MDGCDPRWHGCQPLARDGEWIGFAALRTLIG